MNDLRLGTRARQDLIEIREWIGRDNPTRASSFVEEIARHLELLAERPQIGRARPDLGSGVRSIPHGRYLIVYRPRAGGIDIVRVVHGRRDLGAALHTRR